MKQIKVIQFLCALIIIVFFLSCRGTKLAEGDWNITKDSSLVLKHNINIIDDSLIVFSVTCKRLKINDEAYFPSSKDFVVEVYTEKDNLIWKSDLNMSYLQVITPIEPTKVDEEYTYTMEWDGIINNGKKLPRGKYKIKLILPARPIEYELTTDFVW